MKAWIEKLYTGLSRTKAVYCVGCILVYLALTVLSGGSLLHWLLLCTAVGVYLCLPGVVFCHVLGLHREFPRYRFPISLVCGIGFLTVLYCFSMRLHMLWLLRSLPLLLSAAGVLLLAQERQQAKKQGKPLAKKPRFSDITPNGWLLCLLGCTLVLLYTFTSVVKNAHPTTVGDILLNHDFLWNVGNANAFEMAFPPQDIRFYDVRLAYHYLSEMLAGILGLLTGIPPYDIIGFYLQPLLLAALVTSLYLFGGLFYQGRKLPTMLFTFSMFLFSCASLWKILPNGWSKFNNSNIQHLITNINAQCTAIILLCAYGGLLLQAARQRFRVSLSYLAVTVGAFILLTVGKGPVAAIVAIATILTILFLLFEKKAGWQGLLLAAAVAGSFALIYQMLFSAGAGTSTRFSFFLTLTQGHFVNVLTWAYYKGKFWFYLITPVLYVVQTVCTVPAQFLLYARSIGQDAKRLFQVEADHLFAHACAAGGLLAYYLFSHPHKSQVYFLFLAIFCINLLACDQLDALRWPKGEDGKKHIGKKAWLSAAAVLCGVGVVTSGFLYINFFGSGGRQFCRNIGLIPKYDYQHYTTVMTKDDEEALHWLHDNSEPTAMFATNRIHTGMRREGISNVYTAFSGRQAFMEGFQYAVTNMGVSEPIVSERIWQNALLFDPAASKEDIMAVCGEHGITHLVYCTQQGAESEELCKLYHTKDTALRRYFPCVFESETCRIYETGAAPVPRG